MAGHKQLGGSNDAGWCCPAQITTVARLPKVPDEPNAARDLGTEVHRLLASFGLSGADPETVFALASPEVDNERAWDQFRKCCEAHDALIEEGWVLDYEAPAEFGEYIGFGELAGGTADLIGQHGTDPSRALIGDYKTGTHPASMQQLKRYSLALLADKQVQSVELVLIQPSVESEETFWMRREVVTREALEELANSMRNHAFEATGADPKFVAGEHCKWCPARGACRAHGEYIFPMISAALVDEEPDPKLLTDYQTTQLILHKQQINEFIKAAEQHMRGRLIDGAINPKLKLVRGISRRRWSDENAAQKRLIEIGIDVDSVAPRKLVSPAQAEKLGDADSRALAKSVVAQLSESPVGSIDLAPIEDRRKAVDPTDAKNSAAHFAADDSVHFSDFN